MSTSDEYADQFGRKLAAAWIAQNLGTSMDYAYKTYREGEELAPGWAELAIIITKVQTAAMSAILGDGA